MWKLSIAFIVINLRFYECIDQNNNFNRAETVPQCNSLLESRELRSRHFEIQGHWTSQRCEVRSGPKFLLRSYLFRNDGNFALKHHYYEDGSCSAPLHTISSRGKLKFNSIRKSFRIIGATEMRHHVKKITLRAHTSKSRLEFYKILSSRCRHCLNNYDVTNHSFVIFQSSNNCDCLETIDFYLGELEIIKIMEGIVRSDHVMQGRTQLYVGNIKVKSDTRRYYRSNTFQDPMLKLNNNIHCDVCDEILRSNERHPPKLHLHIVEAIRLDGNWMSVRCEVRPQSVFLTRDLIFVSSANTWQGIYSYFVDPVCKTPTYKLRAVGKFEIEKPSSVVHGAYDAMFNVTNLFVTSQDETVSALFNSFRHPRLPRIITNVEFDVTQEQGLAAIGLHLPNKEYELMKMNGDLLFTGRRPDGGGIPDTAIKRATSFQDELKRCENSENKLEISENRHHANKVFQKSSEFDGLVRSKHGPRYHHQWLNRILAMLSTEHGCKIPQSVAHELSRNNWATTSKSSTFYTFLCFVFVLNCVL